VTILTFIEDTTAIPTGMSHFAGLQGLPHLTVESSSLSAPSTRVVATLLSGSDRRQVKRGRLAGSLTTTSDADVEGGAVDVTLVWTPGLAATMVLLLRPKSCDGRSQIDDPAVTVAGAPVVVPGAHATGVVP
jgi:hypothetical protein